MIIRIYAIHDKAAEAFGSPLFFQTDAMAERAFTQAINDDANQYGKSPEDFTLFCIGDYDDESGQLIPAEINGKIGNGLQYLRPE